MSSQLHEYIENVCFIIMFHLSCCGLPDRSRGAQGRRSLQGRCSPGGNTLHFDRQWVCLLTINFIFSLSKYFHFNNLRKIVEIKSHEKVVE